MRIFKKVRLNDLNHGNGKLPYLSRQSFCIVRHRTLKKCTYRLYSTAIGIYSVVPYYIPKYGTAHTTPYI